MRVTGGSARGRVLKVPSLGTVRPTSDKMRQQLFNMLMHSPWSAGAGFDLEGAHVLDGFCGTGSLGLEALSREAASCVFVDYDGRVLQFAKDNINACGFSAQAQFMMKGCQKLGPRPDNVAPRNLVLLDPPYKKDFIAPTLAALAEGGWLAPAALVVAESESGISIDAPAVLIQTHVRVAGTSQLNIWQAST